MKQDQKPRPRQLTSFVTFRLARLQASLNAQATAILKANSGLSLVEWRILQTLEWFEFNTLKQLSDITEIDKGQLSRKIASMVDKGLLKQTPDELDKRVQHLNLTQRARDICAKAMPIMQARQDLLLKDVSKDDLEVFYKVIDKLEAASKTREIP
ncbi:MAG: MarR family winged helix-turn-helix transcriptional regulator [Cognatishimia activa]